MFSEDDIAATRAHYRGRTDGGGFSRVALSPLRTFDKWEYRRVAYGWEYRLATVSKAQYPPS